MNNGNRIFFIKRKFCLFDFRLCKNQKRLSVGYDIHLQCKFVSNGFITDVLNK
jgi:hypothetical protein